MVVPEGVRLEDAGKIVPQQEIFYFWNEITQTRDIAPFADYFRLKLLYELGGWYCDVDTVCLSSELPVGPRVWASQCPELKERDSTNNDLLFFEKKDPVVQVMLQRCRDTIPQLKRREALGPALLTSTLQEMGLPKDMLAGAETFHPIRWVEAFKLWLPEFIDEVEETIRFSTFLPLYQSLPLYIGFDPQRRPPKGSYLAKLLSKFVPESTGIEHEADDVRQLTSRWLRSNDWAVEWLESINGPPTWREVMQS
jgi:Glycosyltransferase sugar-binding region containing DXD motif